MSKTYKLFPFLSSDTSIRLNDSDRAFFNDLAKVRIIDTKDADKVHYTGRKTGSLKRLNRLADAGLLKRRDFFHPGKGASTAFEFASDDVARAFGGKAAAIGTKCSAFHEVITSKVYFSLDRPESYRLASDFSKDDCEFFRQLGASSPIMPDACFVDEAGEVVAVESDAGQYNQTQIAKKVSAWQGVKQVWGQPTKSHSKIQQDNVAVLKF